MDWRRNRVFRHETDEMTRTLKLALPHLSDLAAAATAARVCQDLIAALPPHSELCPKCGLKFETVPRLPSKAPFSKDFEDAVGFAYESAAARHFGLAAGTARAIDQRYLEFPTVGEQPGGGRAAVVRPGPQSGNARRVPSD
jgi:hypothetical protein